jgi:hypothetical protein
MNMSLDDSIKANKPKVKKPKAKAGAKGKAAAAPAGKKGAKKTKVNTKTTNKQAKGKKGDAMDVVATNKVKKVAKAAATTNAKRGASMNAKRGIAAPKDNNSVKALIKKEAEKMAKQMISKHNKNVNSKTGGGKNVPILKVSFRPSELSRTTPKTVEKQIKGLFAKAHSKKGGPSRAPERKIKLK